MADPNIVNDLEAIDRLLEDHRSRIIIEDNTGNQYDVTRTRVVGMATDDPGLVLHIQPSNGGAALF